MADCHEPPSVVARVELGFSRHHRLTLSEPFDFDYWHDGRFFILDWKTALAGRRRERTH